MRRLVCCCVKRQHDLSNTIFFHKVRIYKEYHSVCPLVGIGTLPTPLSPASVPLPPELGGGGHTRLRLRGCGSPNSDDFRKAEHSDYSVIFLHRSSKFHTKNLTVKAPNLTFSLRVYLHSLAERKLIKIPLRLISIIKMVFFPSREPKKFHLNYLYKSKKLQSLNFFI